MNTYPSLALLIAGIVFGIVAIMHVVRLLFKSPVIFGSKSIPLWVSVLGLIVSAALSVWMFMASCSLEMPASGDQTITSQ